MFQNHNNFFKIGENTMLKKRHLGKLEVSMQGLGCMGMSEFYGQTNQEESLRTLERAFELGVNFFDTADTYGFGANEELLRLFMSRHQREQFILATKCGIVRDKNDPAKRGVNNQIDYILHCCDESLKRLGTNYIDLYYLHRVNEDHDGQGAPLEESMRAFATLLLQGKIRHVGLSETYTDGKHGLTAVQTEYSLWSRGVETNGVLRVCEELGIGFVPYSPLGRGFLTATISTPESFAKDDFRRSLPRFQPDAIQHNQILLDLIQKMATQKGCTPAQLSLRWVLSKGDFIVPIPGTKRLQYLEENVAPIVAEKLSLDEMRYLDQISSGHAPAEARYTQAAMQVYKLTI